MCIRVCVYLLQELELLLVEVDDLELHRDDGVLENGEEENGVVQEVEADEGVKGHLFGMYVHVRVSSVT